MVVATVRLGAEGTTSTPTWEAVPTATSDTPSAVVQVAMLAPRVATTSVELIVRASRMWKFTIVWIPTAPRLRVQRRPGVSVLVAKRREPTTATATTATSAEPTASTAAVTISRSTALVIAKARVTVSATTTARNTTMA